MSHCLDDNTIALYLHGKLDELQRDALHDHIDECVACRQLVAALARCSTPTQPASSAVPPAMMLQPGAMVDEYQVIRLIGRGAMSDVYLARDSHLGRKVALKLLWAREQDPDGVPLEARATARFNHPHIVTLYSVGTFEGFPYLSLEYLEGESLRARLGSGPLTPATVLRYGLAVAEALSEAHAHHIVHGDLKPENVLISRDGRLRVLDFGLSRWRGGREATDGPEPVDAREVSWPWHELVPEPRLAGTPPYMAPELFAGTPATEASDVWALGVLLFEMIRGTRPFAGQSLPELARRVRQDAPWPPWPEDTTAPKSGLRSLVDSCLAKRAEARLSALDAGQTLRRLLEERSLRAQPENPFRGLLPFAEEHVDLFFGRDEEVDALLEQLRIQPVVPMVGPSGVGKTSLLRAGLIPRLRDELGWSVLYLVPGPQPLASLAAALQTTASERRAAELRRLADEIRRAPHQLSAWLRDLAAGRGRNLLLVIDQLEEVFTAAFDAGERDAFLQAVLRAADDVLDPVRVLWAIRDDYFYRAVQGQAAFNRMGQVFVLRAPDRAALRNIIRRPLERTGYHYDEEKLVDEMVAEVGDRTVALPLLQFLLWELWRRRDTTRRLLRRSDYQAMGGIGGALAQHAETLFHRFSPMEQQTVRQVLLRLVTPEGARRSLDRKSATEGLGMAAAAVLDVLVEARLLTTERAETAETGEGQHVQLAHEALVRSWDRLARWFGEEQLDLRLLSDASDAAAFWDRRGKQPTELWQGQALADALRASGRVGTLVTPQAAEFLRAGKRHEQARRWRRRVTMTGILACLAAIALVTTVRERSAQRERSRAETQQHLAETSHAEALLEGAEAARTRGDFLEARAQLRSSLELRDAPQARMLWQSLADEPQMWRTPTRSVVFAVDFSRDSKLAAAALSDRTILLLDTVTGAIVRVLRGHRDRVLSVAFSPRDKARLASSSQDGEVRLWRTDSGDGLPVRGRHSGGVWGLAFSPDGRVVGSGGVDAKIRLWDVSTGEALALLQGHGGGVNVVRFSPDGSTLASGSDDRTIRLWDLRSHKQTALLPGHRATVYDLAFHPRAPQLLSVGSEARLLVWDLRMQQAVRELPLGAPTTYAVCYSADGRFFATGSVNRQILVWDARRAVVVQTLAHQSAAVRGLAFHPTRSWLASAGADEAVRLWTIGERPPSRPEGGHRGAVFGVAFSRDGRTLATGSADRTIRLWDVASGKVSRRLDGHTDQIWAVAFSADGKQCASASADGTAALWDAATGERLRVLAGHQGPVHGVAFSPDGRSLATVSRDRTGRLWNVASGETTRVLTGHAGAVWNVAFDPHGDLLATSSSDATVRLWALARRPLPSRPVLSHPRTVAGVAFHPSGDLLGTGCDDGGVRLWDLHQGTVRQIGTHDGRVYRIAFDPTGTLLGAPSSDGAIRIWDLGTGRYRALWGHRSEVNAVAFSPDGGVIATTSDDATVRVWSTKTGRPFWRGPVLLSHPPRLYSHRGGITLDQPDSKPTPSAGSTGWSRAVVSSELGEVDPSGRYLCLIDKGAVALWDLHTDHRLAAAQIPRASRVVATPQACLVLAGVNAYWLAPGQALTPALDQPVRAVAWTGDTAVVLSGASALAVRQGHPARRIAAVGPGATAVAIAHGQMVLGYPEGRIEAMNLASGAPAAWRRLASASASGVEVLQAGPRSTLISGFADGTVILWDLFTRRELGRRQLHGAVTHVLSDHQTVYATTELGDYLSWDLGVLGAEYGALLTTVRERIPVVWQGGRAIEAPSLPARARRPAADR